MTLAISEVSTKAEKRLSAGLSRVDKASFPGLTCSTGTPPLGSHDRHMNLMLLRLYMKLANLQGRTCEKSRKWKNILTKGVRRTRKPLSS